MTKVTTKSLYQELIKQTLIDNGVRTMTFKGNDNFAKKYSHVYITKGAHDYSMLVFLNDLETPFGNFYFSIFQHIGCFFIIRRNNNSCNLY